MNMAVTNTTRLREMLRESIMSRKMVGSGMSIVKRMTTTPPASRMSPCLAKRS